MPVTFTIPPEFNGPPSAGHGGYVCGRLAALAGAHLSGDVRVALHAPVPLGRPLGYEQAGQRGYAFADGELIATVSPAGLAARPAPPVPPSEAAAAQARFGGRQGHPFPTCFVCGVERPGGIGLAPGSLPSRPGTVACEWTPGRHLSRTGPAELVWSVLDCPGGWTCDLASQPRVLASMTARIAALPRAGLRYVITGELIRTAGRAITSSTALYDPAGELLACATTIWLTVGVTLRCPPWP